MYSTIYLLIYKRPTVYLLVDIFPGPPVLNICDWLVLVTNLLALLMVEFSYHPISLEDVRTL